MSRPALSSQNPNLPTSTPGASSSTSTPLQPKKLAPIFTRTYSRPRPIAVSQPAGPSSSPCAGKSDEERPRKRSRHDASDEPDSSDCSDEGRGRAKIQEWFVTTPIRGEMFPSSACDDVKASKQVAVDTTDEEEQGLWRRRYRRGHVAPVNMTAYRLPRATPPQSFFSLLKTGLTRSDPSLLPSELQIPSLHPWDHPRDYAPPLAVAFSHKAKLHPAKVYRGETYRSRRFVAIAAEEGGVRVVDVDEPQGHLHESDRTGTFWRAHGNAILDIKWSYDDSRILTASGDASCRLHTLDQEGPHLVAQLLGHGASVKTCAFFDPTGSGTDASMASTIATGSRDGNIFIYDVRAPGYSSMAAADASGNRRSSRTRYSSGVEGFRPQIGQRVYPVMEIKGAHGVSKKKTSPYSISAVLALQSMPGRLASGACNEGVVKTWDPRYVSRSSAASIASLPDPTTFGKTSRPRGIHAMAEQPSTGDIHLLTADASIHVVRPGIGESDDAVQLVRYTHPLLRSTYWMTIAFSPCGQYLASGSAAGGLMCWDTAVPRRPYVGGDCVRVVQASRFGMGTPPDRKEREICAVDWGHDMVAACAGSAGTKIWRRQDEEQYLSSRPPQDAPTARRGADWYAGLVVEPTI